MPNESSTACDHPWKDTAHRCHVNSDVMHERDYTYTLVRTHKETGKQDKIEFTPGILYGMKVFDSEWKAIEAN